MEATSQPGHGVVLRDPRPGDMGWVVEQHGALYAAEWGYGAQFEALVAEVAARLLRRFDPAWEKGWIAELDGERVGCVFLVRKTAKTAQLRLLILTPRARGLGLGQRLVDASIAFAAGRGYSRIVLWTQESLVAARGIYASRGFVLTGREPAEAFGQPVVHETWELRLARPSGAQARPARPARSPRRRG